MSKIKEIKISFGGPCVYAQGVMDDGRLTGKIQKVGQSQEELEQELIASLDSGRDDVDSFVSMITGRRG